MSSIRSRPELAVFDYDPHDWRSHFFDIHGSVLPVILWRILTVVVWAIIVVEVHMRYAPIGFPETGLGLVGFAISLLLVFRTNSAYDKFWEGRKQWGAIVNETRNLARLSAALLERDPARAARIARWAAVFAHAVRRKLRGDGGLEGPTARLPEAGVRACEAAKHVPLAVARRIAEEIAAARREGHVSDIQQIELDRMVTLLVGYMGACERILSTPTPFGYVVHLRRALLLYALALPFALVDDYGHGAILAVTFVAFVLFGIEEIGVEIENPFGTTPNDLPLNRICATIEGNLEDIAGDLEARAA
jgi:putative membrane protein